jgi:hypothetical protein
MDNTCAKARARAYHKSAGPRTRDGEEAVGFQGSAIGAKFPSTDPSFLSASCECRCCRRAALIKRHPERLP